MGNTDRKSRVTSKDLVVTYLLSGIADVAHMLADHTSPVATLDKAISEIAERGAKDTSELEGLRDRFAAARGNGQRGRKAARPGETRDFSVQKVGDDGDLFIRLPVSLLGVKKGNLVRVTFGADSLTVEHAPQGASAED